MICLSIDSFVIELYMMNVIREYLVEMEVVILLSVQTREMEKASTSNYQTQAN